MEDSSKKYDHKGHTLYGWFKESEKEWYRGHVSKIHDGIIVEVGVFGGASLLSIVDICIENNNKLYGIDPWDLLTYYNDQELKGEELLGYRKIMKRHKDNLISIIEKEDYQNIELIQGFSQDYISSFEDNSIDMLYLDANHSYDEVLKDLHGWLPKVKEGGILGGDDYAWRAVKKAVDQFAEDKKLTLNSYENTWEMLV
jgi:predicted O-methyltransferase YrrM